MAEDQETTYIEPECQPLEEMVEVPLILDGNLIISLALQAHSEGITLNDLLIRYLQAYIKEDEQGKLQT